MARNPDSEDETHPSEYNAGDGRDALEIKQSTENKQNTENTGNKEGGAAIEKVYHEPNEESGADEHAYEDAYEDADEPTEVDTEASGGMTFLDHLEELRWTVGRSLLAFIIGVVIVTLFIDDIAQFLKMPIIKAYGSVERVNENLITYRPMGVISVFIQIAFLGGLTLSMPFILYFMGCFVAPGLTEKERSVLRPACVAAFGLFLAGVGFAFFALLPITLSFSVRLNEFFGFDLLWAASEYYNMVVWFSLATGLFFQFPLVITVLTYLGVLPVAKLRSIRAGVFVGLMVFSAFLTPGGDFISLPLTTGLMYALYELAIWVGAIIERRKREDELRDDL